MTMQQWNSDLSHSSVGFSVRHLMVSKVHGRFSTFKGVLELDEEDLTRSRIDVEIDAASLDTREPKRDEHLRSADFLDVAKHPTITFRSTSIERDGGDYRVLGDLTIAGTTRPVTLEVEDAGRVKDPWGGERAGFSARTTIHRKDFGLTWNVALEAGGVLVGDKIEITIELEAIKAVAARADAA
jgi:polyisoprenoid-binding protein YceI